MLSKKIPLILFFIFFPNLIFADSKMELGQKIFNEKAQCGSCHTMKTNNSKGNIGPNLDNLKPSIPTIINAVTNGVGVMPPWNGILTREEIEAVAHYVFNSTNN